MIRKLTITSPRGEYDSVRRFFSPSLKFATKRQNTDGDASAPTEIPRTPQKHT